uniref:Flavin-containing monooxygenase n=1 Tax=Saccoglossus kowalevskii TaxID=10224 RepID=A0ABM0M1D6_SACKO
GFDNLELYLHVFPPHLKKHTLAFIGFVGGPASAGPGFELQARWSTRVFKGLCNLPDEESMMKEIKIRKDEFYERFGKHGVVVNLVQYQDRLADLIGAKPNFWKLLLTDPKLAYAIMFGPCYPATYRLTGPGVWNKARETIMNTHENHSTKTTLQTEQQGMQFVMLVMVIVSLLLLPFLNIG